MVEFYCIETLFYFIENKKKIECIYCVETNALSIKETFIFLRLMYIAPYREPNQHTNVFHHIMNSL